MPNIRNKTSPIETASMVVLLSFALLIPSLSSAQNEACWLTNHYEQRTKLYYMMQRYNEVFSVKPPDYQLSALEKNYYDRITGGNYSTAAELKKWFRDNEGNLMAEKDPDGRYILRRKTKEYEDGNCALKDFNGYASLFWYLEARGKLIQKTVCRQNEKRTYLEALDKSDPNICYLAQLPNGENKESLTALYRSRSFRWALEQWFHEGAWSADIKNQIQRVSGIHFPDLTHYQNWWRENHEYLIWSEEKGHLTIDESAREEKRPAIEDPTQEMSPGWYWTYYFGGLVLGQWRVGDTLYLISPPSLHFKHEIFPIQKGNMSLEEYQNRFSRSKFLELLEYMIENLPNETNFTNSIPPWLRVPFLKKLTGESFSTRDEWKQWYENNKDHLTVPEIQGF